MSDDIASIQGDEREAIDLTENLLEPDEPAPVAREVDLRYIAGDHRLGPESDAGKEHLHLLRSGVLRFVEDDEAVVQGSTAHERERGNFYGTSLHQLLHPFGLNHVVQSVVERPEIRVDLRHQITGQEPQLLPGFNGRTGQDYAGHLLGQQGLHREGDREVALARTGGADADRDDVLGDRLRIAFLTAGFGTHGTPTSGSQNLGGQDLTWSFVGPHHGDGPREIRGVDPVARLEKHNQFLEQLGGPHGLRAGERNFVASHHDARVRER